MTANWSILQLGDLCHFQTGRAFPQTEQGHKIGDYPFIKVSDMTLPANGTRIVDANNWVSDDTATRMKLKFAPPGSVAFAKIGEGLKAERLREITRPTALDNNMMAAVPNGEVVDSRFLRFLLESVHIASWAEGSALPYLRQRDLAAIPVAVPAMNEQRAIAATLGALDDKIESNRRTMAKIDELFHAIWRRMYDEIPLEAQIPLSDIVTTQYGLTASASSEVCGDKFLRVTDINKANWIDWSSVPSVQIDDSSRTKYGLTKGDLLVARMADPGKSAIYDGGPSSLFASYLVRLKASSLEEALFIYGFLKSADYADYSAGAMTGSVQKNMNAKVIVGAPIKWPASSITSCFAEQARPLREKICQIAEENAGIAAIRDAVLPGLLSGRIRVPVEGFEA